MRHLGSALFGSARLAGQGPPEAGAGAADWVGRDAPWSRGVGLLGTLRLVGVPWPAFVWFAVVGLVLGWDRAHAAQERVLYEARFEASEGFDPNLTLIGQDGWVGQGSGGNGLVEEFFLGEGRQAFIGYNAPTNTEEFLNVWRPVNYLPGPTNPPLVRFSVLMSVEDSSATVTNRDDFRWSVYNSGGDRLFTLDFENESLGINYLLDGEQFVSTGRGFSNSIPYLLEIVMDFEANRWSATLDGGALVSDQPLTTKNLALDFGDVDAVWAIRTPGKPGDNFMVFDNYRVVAISPAPNPPSRLEALGLLRPGEFLVRGHGVAGVSYLLEGSADLRAWLPLKTNTMPADGYFDHLDRSGEVRRFYRLREQ